MNVRSIAIISLLRRFLLTLFLPVSLGLSGCTTTGSVEDTTVYPTPAEKNREMQERMGEISRSLM